MCNENQISNHYSLTITLDHIHKITLPITYNYCINSNAISWCQEHKYPGANHSLLPFDGFKVPGTYPNPQLNNLILFFNISCL